MTRFVVDCGVALKLASDGIEVSAEHKLLAPTLLRSQALSALHEAVHDVALDADLARSVEEIVPTATIEALRTA